jgi:hypothetical protein
MNEKYQIGSRVRLVSFNGRETPPNKIKFEENFWKLIGIDGEIIENVPKKGIQKNRLLVKFDVTLDDLGIHNHNELPDSLWIAGTDLILT